MNYLKYIMLPALSAFSAVSCTVEKVPSRTEEGNILKIQASVPATKSPVSLGNDMIYAYPFALEGDLADINGTPITANSVIGTEYTYYMPQTSQDILFTNITDGSGGYNLTAPADGDTLMKITVADGTSGSSTDLVVGNLAKSDAETGATEIHPIALKRKAAQISLSFRVKQKDSDELLIENLSDFFSEVRVSIPTASTFCVPSISDTVGIYYGEVTNCWSSTDIPAASTLSLIQESFIFPSVPEQTPDITLTVVTTSGNVQTLQSSFGSPIEPNKHYNLTLTLRQRSDGLGFVVDELTHEEIKVDIEYADIVVDPSMDMSVGINTLSVSDTTYKDFVLGTDTLWVYPFMSERGDTLADGYPQPHKAVYNGRYTFSVPKGTQKLLFSNFNLRRPSSDYLASSTPYRLDTTGLTQQDFYVRTNEDYAYAAHRPLITGQSETMTIEGAGQNIDIQLSRHSTGIKFLLELEPVESEVVPALPELVQYYWLGVQNRTYHTYDTYSGNFYNEVYCSDTETGPYDTAEMTHVEYEGRTFWELTPDYLYYFMGGSDARYAYVYVLTSDGKTKSLNFNFDVDPNQLNTIILTALANTLE